MRGAVGSALGVALSRAGWPVGAIATRDPERRDRFQTYVPGARAFAEAAALVDDVDLIILAVPDDALAGIAGSLRLYSGQAMVHTSGALGAEVLEPAMAAGTQIGSFHPLVAFADTERAVGALRGATVAIEGDDQLATLLAEMAEAIGAIAVRLAPGSKAAYHAAAVLAAGGFVALLDAIVELGAVTGLDEAGIPGDLRAPRRTDPGERSCPWRCPGADGTDHAWRHRNGEKPSRDDARTCPRFAPSVCRVG